MQVHIKTYGCQMNERDSEIMGAVLKEKGWQICGNEEDADAIILNCCSVRDQAELKAIGKLQQLIKRKNEDENFLVGICGCMAENLGKELFRRIPKLNFIVGPRQIYRIGEAISLAIKGEKPAFLADADDVTCNCKNNKLHHRNLQELQSSAYVTISNGCNMRCSYCIVPKTRGRETSRPMEAILDEIQLLLESGIREITLLGQIVNFYGMGRFPMINGESPFVQLIRKIHNLKGLDRLRFLSPHPSGFRDDLICCFGDLPKLCPHVHLPIQSGSNRVLQLMRRPYQREKILEITQKLRQRIPLISISTDLIVGFPGETDDDFHETLCLFDEISFDMAYIFKYSRRSGTPAATMDNQVAQSICEERNQVLLEKLKHTSLERNRLFLNSIQPVLVEQHSKRDPNVLFGYTPHRKKTFFSAPSEMIGKIVSVRIQDVSTGCFIGTIIG
ncbi:MAG: tRNA (N6-isopentenyl adenosine(37)-C2)-methylthiotransferase MiaB [Puniceicoccales bacterium]|jgi:tRNA-2-methylthio-N6-dimethylallyladenosine synthase|nr:tRNA (N6-isopentenyl adenosine(37)-C2)-methylthiotransferase MiaB [Puniceicoccales bacterium]